MKQLSINPLSKLYFVYIFFLLSSLVFGQNLDIDLEQNKKIEALEKKIEELEEMMVGKNLSGDIKVNSISVIGSDGSEIAFIGHEDNNGFIKVYNSIGNSTVYLGTARDSAGYFVLNNADGIAGMVMENTEYGGLISVASFEDELSWQIGATENAIASIYYIDDKAEAGIGVFGEGGARIELRNNGDTRLTMGMTDDGSGLMRMFNNNSKEIIYLGVNTNNHGLIHIKDRFGEENWWQSGNK